MAVTRVDSPVTRVTIGETFDSRRNSLNFLRVCLSLLVVLSHSFAGGFVDPLLLNHTTVGDIAVYGFFGISGYLIASSASHNSLGRYLWQRFLRIFPGFWVCLIVTGALFGVVAWFHEPHPHCPAFASCYIGSPTGPFQYLYHDLLLRMNQQTIALTPGAVPWPFTWNVPLWTLFYEFMCYLILGAFAVSGLLRRRGLVALLTAGLWAIEVIVGLASLNLGQGTWAMLTLAPIFLTGTLLYLYRDKVPDSGILAMGCATVFLASPWLPFGGPFTVFRNIISAPQVLGPFIAYPLFWLGIHLPFHKIGARNDYSYGIYIYAFLVQQILALWHVQRWGYIAYMTLSVVFTVPFAVASWWLVEKNALKLKKFSPGVGSRRLAREGAD